MLSLYPAAPLEGRGGSGGMVDDNNQFFQVKSAEGNMTHTWHSSYQVLTP